MRRMTKTKLPVAALPAVALFAATLAATLAVAPVQAQDVPAPASPGPGASGPAASGWWDPWESANRAVYGFNNAFGDWVTRPAAEAYASSVPATVQDGVSNVFANLREPVTAVSSLLQGDMANARASAGRFAINSTVGIGGLYDVATGRGWLSRSEDAGTLLCAYGTPSGPYVVLPFVGPTTLRDAIGLFAVYGLTYGILGDELASLYIVSDRAAMMLGTTPVADPYQNQQELYLQQREALCREKAARGPLGAPVPAAPSGLPDGPAPAFPGTPATRI